MQNLWIVRLYIVCFGCVTNSCGFNSLDLGETLCHKYCASTFHYVQSEVSAWGTLASVTCSRRYFSDKNSHNHLLLNKLKYPSLGTNKLKLCLELTNTFASMQPHPGRNRQVGTLSVTWPPLNQKGTIDRIHLCLDIMKRHVVYTFINLPSIFS